MKISLNWLKKYVNMPETVSNEDLIRLIGARLVEVEGVIDEMHKYDNIFVVRVETCEKIPDTHLSLCQINDGSSNLVQVVCGAPNVRAGMLAVWIAPGAVVPASVHEDAPFVIGKRKMQGYESNGMLAGADELDFGDDHSGIVEIEPGVTEPGMKLSDLFELDDLILEIENKSLTHRPDCFGMIGFAREVAGILGQEFDDEGVLAEPIFSDARLEFSSTSYAGRPGKTALKGSFLGAGRNIRVENSNHVMHPKKQVSATPSIHILAPGICQRYSAITMEKHGEIEKRYLTWMDTILSKSGMKPISPIVDATNFLMLLTGQPLHAFDYDKFLAVGKTEQPTINVRLARKGEELELLDDTLVELNENDIVICSGDVPVALAGAMGGKSTMIDDTTRNIIIESATFSLYNLRKTQMAHGIFSEAITRFTKGQPAYQTLSVARACAEMLSSGFEMAAEADEYPNPEKQVVVEVTTSEINRLLGTNYDSELIGRTLANVGFQITFAEGLPEVTTEDEGASPVTTGASDPSPKQMVIEIPSWRTDIHIKEDIVEEVGRLLGYDNILPTLPLHATADKNPMWEFKKLLRGILTKYGANEVLNYSFVSERLLKHANQDIKNSYKIVNSISPDLQYERQSIVPSLLEKAYKNEKLPVEKFAIYEMNQIYRKDLGVNSENVPNARMSFGFVVAERKNKETAFYKAKKYAAKLLEELQISAEFVPIKSKNAECKPFEPKRTAEILVDGEYIGVVGEFKNSVRNEFKLAEYLAGFEIDMDLLMRQMSHKKQINLLEMKHEDLTVTTDKTYAEALKDVEKQHPDAVITPGVIYQAEGQKTKNMTFHIALTK
ncbi:phenylalanine--tRNA ligase subunit beta [Candidatus Saccharibacteria bacterium]|nr:phenylalanine--tRNA ligase subunit beta [Candidatus Saccharibacteria bacterium]